MARLKGSKDTKPRQRRSKTAADNVIPIKGPTLNAGKNMEPDDEHRLLRNYVDRISPIEEQIASLMGQKRVLYKEAKGEGLKSADIKFALSIKKNPIGQFDALKRQQTIFIWYHPERQADLFGQADTTDAEERAFNDGKRAGLAGEACHPPKHFSAGDLMQNWIAGHAAGQKVNRDKFLQSDEAGADDPMPGADDAPAPADEHADDAVAKDVTQMLN